MSGDPRRGGEQLEDIANDFLNATSETREAIAAISGRRDTSLETLLKHLRTHALTLATALNALEQFYELSRPTNPARIQEYTVAEMDALWAVLKSVQGDIRQFYLFSIDRLEPLPLGLRTEWQTEEWQTDVTGVIKSCRAGRRAIRAVWDAMAPSEKTTTEQSEARAETRDKAVDALNELAKQLRGLADVLAARISDFSRQSDSA